MPSGSEYLSGSPTNIRMLPTSGRLLTDNAAVIQCPVFADVAGIPQSARAAMRMELNCRSL
jgi:hypothetical protein